eukprot:5479182-Amphidinium_carterae.4
MERATEQCVALQHVPLLFPLLVILGVNIHIFLAASLVHSFREKGLLKKGKETSGRSVLLPNLHRASHLAYCNVSFSIASRKNTAVAAVLYCATHFPHAHAFNAGAWIITLQRLFLHGHRTVDHASGIKQLHFCRHTLFWFCSFPLSGIVIKTSNYLQSHKARSSRLVESQADAAFATWTIVESCCLLQPVAIYVGGGKRVANIIV